MRMEQVRACDNCTPCSICIFFRLAFHCRIDLGQFSTFVNCFVRIRPPSDRRLPLAGSGGISFESPDLKKLRISILNVSWPNNPDRRPQTQSLLSQPKASTHSYRKRYHIAPQRHSIPKASISHNSTQHPALTTHSLLHPTHHLPSIPATLTFIIIHAF